MTIAVGLYLGMGRWVWSGWVGMGVKVVWVNSWIPGRCHGSVMTVP